LATGPYEFARDWDGQTLTLVKNEEWSASTDPGRHQFVDTFTFEFGLDDNAIQQQIIADEGADQYALSSSGLLADNFPLIRGSDVEKGWSSGRVPGCPICGWTPARFPCLYARPSPRRGR
jgi:peptide/nickel transport system substrate-binding protein